MNLMRVFYRFFIMNSQHNILINNVLNNIRCKYIEKVM